MCRSIRRPSLSGRCSFSNARKAKALAYDEKLAQRIRKRLGKRAGLTEKKMFGGIGFMLNGNLCCGVHGQEMIVRIDPQKTDQTLGERHTRAFDLTGRAMKGWILVAPDGLSNDAALAKGVRTGADYAATLRGKR